MFSNTDNKLLGDLKSFLCKKFESMSGQLLTSDTNRGTEIIHGKLVKALNAFLPLKPSKRGANRERIDRELKCAKLKISTLEALLNNQVSK